MNAILFYSFPTLRLTGSIINAIEYFLQGYENNRELKLIILNGTYKEKSIVINLIKDRYIIDGLEGFERNIVYL